MKTLYLLLVSYLVVPGDNAAIVQIPSEFGELTPIDKADLDYVKEYIRAKRSGSGDILDGLKTSIGQGIKSKIGMLARGSASASSHFSSGSHGSPHHYHHQDDGPKLLDIWTMKKSIFQTLLSAVKAIKGGVIAIKGQIIKGGGHLLSAKGKLITGGGEAISNLGKSIATSAFLVMPSYEPEHHAPAHYDHEPPSHYHHQSSGPSAPSGPSGPDVYHSAPSGPAAEYGPPDYHKLQYSSGYQGKHDGIVILKKIPSGPADHDVQETKTPDFKPLPEHSSPQAYPGFSNFVNSVFTASSDPRQNTHEVSHHQPYNNYNHNYNQYPQHGPTLQQHDTAQHNVPGGYDNNYVTLDPYY